MRPAAFIPPSLPQAALLAVLLAMPLTGCTPAVRGSMALSRGEHAQALALYNEALQGDPQSNYLRQRIGLTYFAMKDYARAEASFQDILQRSPGEPEALFYLGLSRIGKGEGQAALKDFAAFHWPFKFYHQQFVKDEAARLLKHPEMPPEEAIGCLQDALEKGRQEQLLLERDQRLGLN